MTTKKIICPTCKGCCNIENPQLTQWIADGKDRIEFIKKIAPPHVKCNDCSGQGIKEVVNE